MKQKIPRNRQEAIDLANKIKEIRKDKFKNKEINIPVLLRLKEMPYYQRQAAMQRLVSEGYAENVGEIEKMLRKKEVVRSVTPSAAPVDDKGMSDNRKDNSIQYIHINNDLI